MNNNTTAQVASAKLILVPKGDDSKPCLEAFTAATGITVPAFSNRKLSATAQGRTFVKIKGRDIPALIAAGYGDIGMTGSDSCEDYLATANGIVYQTCGESMCRFVLLAPKAKAAAVSSSLMKGKQQLLVATSFPKLLGVYAKNANLNLATIDLQLSGSVEVMPRLLNVPLVADLVATGETARVNGLIEVKTLKEVYPAIVSRDTTNKVFAAPSYDDLELIDATLAKRGLQITDASVVSPTLNLLRDTNKAGKKAGEEFGEVMMAIFGDGSIADCESEVADLIYAQLAAAYSRNKPIKLGNIIRILIERNRQRVKP
jgi:ATP phosphoribosyltransferase